LGGGGIIREISLVFDLQKEKPFMNKDKMQMKIINDAGEVLYVAGPRFDEFGNSIGDINYYLYSKNISAAFDSDVVEVVDPFYCWFHNYKYYRPVLKYTFGERFFEFEKMRNSFLKQNKKRFNVLWGMGNDYGGFKETGVVVCYDSKLHEWLFCKVDDNEYIICKINFDSFKNDEIDPFNYNENAIIARNTEDKLNKIQHLFEKEHISSGSKIFKIQMKLQPNKFEVTCKTADNFFSTRFKFH
jgi:hypothetical protein